MSTEIPPTEKLFDKFSALDPKRMRDQVDSPTAISQLAEQASGDPDKVLFGDGRFDFASASGGLPDAPSDGTAYGRENAAWVHVLPLTGGTMTGAITLAGAPAAPLQPATKGYVDSNTIPDAPSNGVTYGRLNTTWTAVLPTTGGSLSGPLVLASDPTLPLGATTKQYVDAHAFPEAPSDSYLYGRVNAAWARAVPLAGGTMTGPLTLSADPTSALNAATKQYVDAHAGGIPDAPSDNSYYGRINAAWSPVLSIAGGTLTGPLVLAADPTTSLQAATKQYVDAHAGGGGLVDAPSDGTTYGRSNAAWVNVLPLTGGTLTGALTIAPTSGIPVNQIIVNAQQQPSIVLNATTASSPKFVLGKNAGSNRWLLAFGDAQPESGGNVGDNFSLNSYDDSGNYLATPLSITRPGVSTFGGPMILNADPATALGAATKQYADGKVAKAGDTMTGALTIAAPSGPALTITPSMSGSAQILIWPTISPSSSLLGINKNGTSQVNRVVGYAGTIARWELDLGDGAAESGSNAGSNFSLTPYSDSGTALTVALTVNRATSLLTLAGDPTAALGAVTKQYADTKAPLASPAFTGTPTAPTPSVGNNSTDIATTAFVQTAAGSYLPLAGGTLTGNLILNADPTVSLGAATKQYVDNTKLSDAPSNSVLYGRLNGAWTAAVPIAGGTMTGALTLSGDPTTTNGAATKHYVDTAPFLPVAGGTMTGTLTLNAAPSSPLQAATKGYVDGLVFPDAPSDGHLYGRSNAAWVQAVPIAGGTMTGSLILNADPSAALGAVTKQYVDATIQGLTPKPTARLATTATLPANTYVNGTAGVGATLTANANGALTVDGVAVASNDIVLVKNEAAAANNGLYTVTATGSGTTVYVLTRHVDMDAANEFAGAFIPVGNAGTVNANSLWLANPSTPVTVGTTSIPFTQLNGATDLTAGNGLSISGNTISAIGTANRIVSTAGGIDISASYVGQTSITTLGTIATGTWNGTAIANGNLAAMAANTLKGNNTGSSAAPIDLTVAQAMTLLGAAPLASPTFTGTPAAPTPATADNTTKIATTAYVKAQGYLTGNQTITLTGDATGSGATSIATTFATVNSNVGTFQGITVNGKGLVTAAVNQNYAPLASPTFTGVPAAPTPATADNSTAVATTAYVQAQGYAVAANYLPLTGGTLSGSLNMTVGTYQWGGKNLAYIVTNVSGDSAFFGESGNTTLTGLYNLGSGFGALSALTSGNYNVALGADALSLQTGGGSNVGVGVNALRNESSASNNVAIGFSALNTQNGAASNIGIGLQAGYDLTTGGTNTIVGHNTGRGITTGGSNTIVGASLTGLPAALASTLVLGAGATVMSLVASTNAFHGGGAGNLTLTGTANASLGWTSSHALTSGANNAALGSSALAAETTGSGNVAIGKSSLTLQNGASGNTAIGQNTGPNITTGGSNTLIGANAGTGLTTGSGNIFLSNLSAVVAGTTNCFGWGMAGSVRQDWNLTTANTHTFTGGPVAQNATPTAGATPAYVSAGTFSQTTATSNTPALPTTRTNGYLLIAFGRVTGSTGTTITCSTAGWTQIVNNAGGGRAFAAYYAYVTGSEVAPVFTLGTTDTSDAWVLQYSGTAASSPIGASAVSSGGAATTLNLTGITTTRYNSKVVVGILCGGLSGSLTPPAAYTQQSSVTDGGWFDAPQVAAGTATGTLAFTCSPALSNWGGFVVELLIPPLTPAANRHIGEVLGTNRWSINLTDGTQESGSNAGSNLTIVPYSDAGAALTTALTITRATGIAAFAASTINVNGQQGLSFYPAKQSYFIGNAAGNATAGATNTFNICIGDSAGAVVAANKDIFIGTSVGAANTTGSGNTGVGHHALLTNIDGLDLTAVGSGALASNDHGNENTAIGASALASVAGSGAINNTGLGSNAGVNCSSGANNTFIGYRAGAGTTSAQGITTGSNNVIIGNQFPTTNVSNCIIITDGAGNLRYDYGFTTASIHTFNAAVRLSTGYTVATLPTGVTGAQAYVTDGAASLAWGATVTGGGSTAYLVWYNGSAWTVVGK